MKSKDFRILEVAVITTSRLQTIEHLNPLRKWTLPTRLGKFETHFHFLTGFDRSFLTIGVASHHQSHQNQWKSRISKDFDEIHGFQDTQCSDHHEITTSDYWKVDSTPEMDFPPSVWESLKQMFMFCLVLLGRSLLPRSLVITKINENKGFLRNLMKSIDFMTLVVAIITRSRLQTTGIGLLIPPRK